MRIPTIIPIIIIIPKMGIPSTLNGLGAFTDDVDEVEVSVDEVSVELDVVVLEDEGILIMTSSQLDGFEAPEPLTATIT